ncbi:MAG: energy-coupling factor transporter ATPase [Candidatus Alcyoniella australis]|nr:energy-coupling factor transporter ATPase [Candidatus Alcyoniella australis]
MQDHDGVKLSGVGFSYRNSDRQALGPIDLELRPGQVLAVLGANGAGKSTLVRTLNGLVPKFFHGELRGRIRAAGLDPAEHSVAGMARGVGMVFQDFESQLFSTTCRAEVAFAMENLGRPREQMQQRVPELLERVGLGGFDQRSPASLSGGQKQRLAIASVLALDTQVLVLDEPTTDLDPKGRQEVWALIRELRDQGKTMIIVEHGIEALSDADLALVLDGGKPAYLGPPEPLLLDPELLLRNGVKPAEGALLLQRLNLPIEHWRPTQVAHSVRQAGFTPLSRPEIPPQTDSQLLFEVRGLSFAYPGGPEVLHKLNLQIDRGEIVALLGPNGSGKTTLVKLMTGLMQPQLKGKAQPPLLYDGKPPGIRRSAQALGRSIGFVFQNPDAQIFSPTAFDEVAFGLRNFGVDHEQIPLRVAQALETVGLAGQEQQDPFVMTKGDRQKLAVASVLACEPETIVLDEPSTGLDERELAGMCGLLRRLHERGHTVVMVTHSLAFAAQLARRCIVLDQGRILADATPDELFADPQTCAAANLVPPDAALIARELGLKASTVENLAASLAIKEQG